MAAVLGRDQSKAGIHHFAGSPDISWADFAREIFQQAVITAFRVQFGSVHHFDRRGRV